MHKNTVKKKKKLYEMHKIILEIKGGEVYNEVIRWRI